MATYLYRLGRFAHSRHRLVAPVWLAMLVVFGVGAFALAAPTSSSFTIPGTESQQAIDLLAPLSPGVGTQAGHDLVRGLTPQLVQDRYLAPEIEAVTRAVEAGRFAALLPAAGA